MKKILTNILMTIKKEKYNFEVTAISNIGRIRERNEDNLFVISEILPINHKGTVKTIKKKCSTKEVCALSVFDGMGGEIRGDLASYKAAEIFDKNKKSLDLNVNNIKNFIADLNEAICKEAKMRKITQMGTTISSLIFKGKKIAAVNVGDSPMYLFRDNEMIPIWESHTNEKWLRDNNINRTPQLTQFLGLDYEEMIIEPHISMMEIMKNDIYLICSDGLTDMVCENEIKNIILKNISQNKKVELLLEKALENGGKDNITIIICEF